MTFKRLCFEVQKTMFWAPKGHVLKVKRWSFEKWIGIPLKHFDVISCRVESIAFIKWHELMCTWCSYALSLAWKRIGFIVPQERKQGEIGKKCFHRKTLIYCILWWKEGINWKKKLAKTIFMRKYNANWQAFFSLSFGRNIKFCHFGYCIISLDDTDTELCHSIFKFVISLTTAV